MATDRIILHSAIAPAFLTALKAALSSTPSRSPLPTVVSSTSKERLETIVSEAVSGGAKVLFGSALNPNISSSIGQSAACFGPTVLGNFAEDTEFWNEEVFGPLVGYKIVQSEDEAVSAANNTGYGLSAAVFTKDLRRGLAVAKRIESG
jgi:acyl-CoA reductase-like NAD-dependent aldehyde dehydrogenase